MLELAIIHTVVIAAVVFTHYEALLQLSRLLPRLDRVGYRLRIVLGVIGAMIAHTLEVCLFGFAYLFMARAGLGEIRGSDGTSFVDAIYFSFISYTTLGYGDLAPAGGLRFLAGVESLLGLVLIAWTASFLFFEMERYWQNG